MKIFLVRHGKPDILRGDFYHCHLGKQGIQETRHFASSGKIPKPDLIFSSPYNRTVDTAKVFSDYFLIGLQIIDDFKEWNLQSLNLPDPAYTEQEHMGWSNQHAVVLGNESLDDVKERISRSVRELVEKFSTSETLLMVSHGTVIDMFCASISGRETKLSDIKRMKHLDYAVVEFENRKFELIKDII